MGFGGIAGKEEKERYEEKGFHGLKIRRPEMKNGIPCGQEATIQGYQKFAGANILS